MNKYIIKIRLNSIIKNKDAGNTQSKCYHGKTIRFKAYELPKMFKDGVNCVVQQHKKINGIPHDYEGIITSDDLLKELSINKIKGIEIEIENHFNTVYHSPIPEYSYKYQNKVMKCSYCGEKIKYNDLNYDDIDIYTYSNTVCPECGEWDCVELEYEKIEDALKRFKKEYHI